MKNQTVATLANNMRPWLLGSLAVLLTTGVLLFLSEAVKCFYNQSFWVKMITLPIALLFTFTVRERFAQNDEATATIKLVAIASMSLWFTVAAAGRWIGFS